jgi:hypothetical protein
MVPKTKGVSAKTVRHAKKKNFAKMQDEARR